MKCHSKSPIDRPGGWFLSLMGLSLAMLPGGPAVAAEEASQEPEKAPVLSQEEFFEGGANTYNSWIELAAGGWFPSGNSKQLQQRQGVGSDVFGGIEDFHYERDLGKEVILQMDGRAIFDNEDYKLSLDVGKWDLGYLKFDFEQYRTWYNGDGGYYPPTGDWYPFGDDALALDRGQFSFEAGLRLEDVPDVTFRYTHRYRDGEKSSTAWGPAVIVGPGGPVIRRLIPSFYDIDERVNVFELDVDHRIKATDLGVGARYETGDLDNTRSIAYDSAGNSTPVSQNDGTSYGLLNVHAYTETWIKKNLFLSSGFLYANLDSDYSGSRNSITTPSQNYTGLNGGSRLNEYTLNLNLMSRPWTHFSIVPSVRVQKKDWDADSGLPATPIGQSDGDALDVRERLELRYTGVTNWVFYGRGEWTQGDGKLNENGGIGPAPAVLRETEDSRFFQKYLAGINWYPVRRVSLDLQYYYKLNNYDYDHKSDSTPNDSGNRYPAYLVMQDFETHDANLRLTLRPSMKVTLVTGYDFQYNTINTKPDSISGVPDTETAQTTSHII